MSFKTFCEAKNEDDQQFRQIIELAQNRAMALHLFRTQEELIKLMANTPYLSFGKMIGEKNRRVDNIN